MTRSIISISLIFAFIIVLPRQLSAQEKKSYTLPEDILLNKQDFDTIPDVIKKYEGQDKKNTSYVRRVNGEKRIQRINFINYKDKPVEIDGEMSFDVPADISRVVRLFGDVRFEGSIAQKLKVYLVNPKGRKYEIQILHGHYWGDKATGIYTTYTKTPWALKHKSGWVDPWNMKGDDGKPIYEGYKLILEGKGTIRSIYIWEEEGMKPRYDITAYTIIGDGKPWLNVKLAVEAERNLSLNGDNKLDEYKFKRYHVNSGAIALEPGQVEMHHLDKAYHKITAEYGFFPGRGAMHFTYQVKWKGLKEDKDRPGYADMSMYDQNFTNNPAIINKLQLLYPNLLDDFVLTTDGWPVWQKVDPDNKHNAAAATPALDKFDAAAELTGRMAKAFDDVFGGYGPKYWEVKNESTISIEWTYMVTHPQQAWDYLADFHNQVSAKVKEYSPGTLVGGPSSAFMYLEQRDFDEARKQLQFMDDTRKSLDYYSHHFYENGHVVTHRDGINADGFLSGRLEAVFGLLNNHGALTKNKKQYYITEEGTYGGGHDSIAKGRMLRSFSGYMLRFMNLSDSIGMITPYLYPLINWRPNGPNQFFKYNQAKNDIAGPDPLIFYLESWKDYKGALIPAKADNNRVYCHAVRHGNKIFVAVHNMNNQRVNLDLNLMAGGAKVVKAMRKRSFIELGKMTAGEVVVEDLKKVPLRVEEFSVFEITLDKEPGFKDTLLRKTYYGNKLLQPTGKTASFKIKCPVDKLDNSTLRIGLGRSDRGFNKDLTVRINGKEFIDKLENIFDDGGFFNVFDFKLPAGIVKGKNKIEVLMPEEGGYVSHIELINEYSKPAPKGVDTSSLKAPLAEAEKNFKAANTWEAKKIHPQDAYDRLTAAKASYKMVIAQAKFVLSDAYATSLEVERALGGLKVMNAQQTRLEGLFTK